MVTLHIGGRQVGTSADLERMLPEFLAEKVRVELRDEAGNLAATLIPQAPTDPNAPLIPWEPDVTREELDRRIAEPGLTIDEVRKQLGWA